ncbi:ATP-binding protein [Occultella kanbiaonis]|uniref:ATP-binding protein n=1 Tax=Occultella kanbiaonis TaxID=2675754 RepID=UPI0012B79476|nr:ATP-binding protein [Occultella kanbiaonis]
MSHPDVRVSRPWTPPWRSTGHVPLRRIREGRVFGGVCAGLAAHLGVDVRWVRIAFVVLSLFLGAGVALYVWFLLTVPTGDPQEEAAQARPTRLSRLVPRLRSRTAARPIGDVVLAVVLIVVAGSLLATRADLDVASTWILPVLVLLGGAALAWSQLGAVERQRQAGEPARKSTVVLRVGGGLALALVGVLMLVGQGQTFPEVLRGAVAGIAILAGAAVVLAPLGLRLWRELVAERAARAREAERADIAAHLHDSVLQTLSLIRSRADDPQYVRRLARAQERELRDWLYSDRPEVGDSVAAMVRQVAAEVEDARGVPIDVVTAGDARPDDGTTPLAAATREALANAVAHGLPPISLYVEIGAESVDVFVRDRGDGFDLAAVPEDRHGVRDSILDRMRRHGGSATIRSDATRGTEIHLRMPRSDGGEET